MKLKLRNVNGKPQYVPSKMIKDAKKTKEVVDEMMENIDKMAGKKKSKKFRVEIPDKEETIKRICKQK